MDLINKILLQYTNLHKPSCLDGKIKVKGFTVMVKSTMYIMLGMRDKRDFVLFCFLF